MKFIEFCDLKPLPYLSISIQQFQMMEVLKVIAIKSLLALMDTEKHEFRSVVSR